MQRRSLLLVVLITALTFSGAGAEAPDRAGPKPRKFAVLVFPDRANPDTFVLVDDFRVNDTIVNPEGDRFFVLRSREGTFQLPFQDVAEVEFTALLATALDAATYEVRVVLPLQGV